MCVVYVSRGQKSKKKRKRKKNSDIRRARESAERRENTKVRFSREGCVCSKDEHCTILCEVDTLHAAESTYRDAIWILLSNSCCFGLSLFCGEEGRGCE